MHTHTHNASPLCSPVPESEAGAMAAAASPSLQRACIYLKSVRRSLLTKWCHSLPISPQDTDPPPPSMHSSCPPLQPQGLPEIPALAPSARRSSRGHTGGLRTPAPTSQMRRQRRREEKCIYSFTHSRSRRATWNRHVGKVKNGQISANSNNSY